MKTLAFFLLLCPFIALSQNGGQYPENGSIKLEWTGTNTIKVTNKQTCESVIHLSYNHTDADVTVPGNSYMVYSLPVGTSSIKAKTTTNCGGTDFGQVELTLVVTPITFKSIHAESLSNNRVKVTFEVADVSGTNTYHIQLSKDGKNYVDKAIYFDDGTKPNGIYSVIIQL